MLFYIVLQILSTETKNLNTLRQVVPRIHYLQCIKMGLTLA